MKSFLSLLLCSLLMGSSAVAQNARIAREGVAEDAEGVQLNIPSSPLVVDLTIEREVATVGIYARYAQKYLGVRGVLSDKVVYTIASADVALTDATAVQATPCVADQVTMLSYLGDDTSFSKVPFDKTSTTDESLDVAARKAANTLFAIRRHRMELITGEAGENVFGAGLQAALTELDRQEQAYTELFLGKRVTTTSVKRIIVTPSSDKQKYILCRFSAEQGILPTSDLTGDAVVLQLEKEKDGDFPLAVASAKASRTACYRVAADVTCILYSGTSELVRQTLPIFEFGRSVEVALPSKK